MDNSASTRMFQCPALPKPTRMSRKRLPAAACSAVLLLAALNTLCSGQAQAGQWVTTTQTTYDRGGRPCPPDATTGGINYVGGGDSAGEQGKVSVQLAMTMTWQSAGDNDPAPPILDLLETSSAGWGGGIGLDASGNPAGSLSGSADDGIGDPYTTSQVLINSPYGAFYSCNGGCSGKKLVRMQPSGGSVNFNVSLQSNLTTSGSGDGGQTVSFSAVPDTRGLTISFPTWSKSVQLDTNGNPVLDQYGNPQYISKLNLPASDGSMQGDVGIADKDVVNNDYTSVEYSANRVGGWNIDNSVDNWSSTLGGNTQTDLLPIYGFGQDIPDFTVDYANFVSGTKVVQYDPLRDGPIYDSPEPGQTGIDTITLTYKDSNDGAVATATYTMNVHNPYENFFQYRPALAAPVTLNATYSSPEYDTSGNLVTATYATNPGDIAGEIGQWTYNVLYPSLPGPIQSILTALNLTPAETAAQYYVNVTTDFWAPWDHPTPDVTWTDALGNVTSTPPDGAAAQAAVGQWKLMPVEKCMYLTSYFRADHYVPPGDSSGYTGFAGEAEETAQMQDGDPYGSGTYVFIGPQQ